MRSRSFIAVPPGVSIKERLENMGMSQKEFAARMGLSEKHISRLINGEVQLTPEVAVKLETVLGVPASFWSNLEALYREELVKVNAENTMEADEKLAREFPYSEMAKLGWIEKTRNIKEKVLNLRKYFGVIDLSLLENRNITKIACRRLSVSDKGDLALLAWVQEAKIKAREVETKTISVRKLIEIVPKIRAMTVLKPEDFCLDMKNLLSECGVALIFLPHLKGSFLHGASFMDGKKIVVGLTARGKDADKFWFSLFHELGHIVLGHIGKAEGTTQDDEQAADEWARDMLISKEDYNEFKATNNFSRSGISAFAKKINIAPGIVVGRLQKDGYIPYNRLNDLKEHYEISSE